MRWPPYSDIFKLCLLTGRRVGEVTIFQPPRIDGDTIAIPATVAKSETEHIIPFNLLTAKYLRRQQHSTFIGFSKAKARMDQKTGVTGWVVHDATRTFATLHAKLGTTIPVVEALLNHRTGSVSGMAAIYIKYNFLAEARKANLIYEQHIAKLVGTGAVALLVGLPAAEWLLADRGYDADWSRDALKDKGIKPCIPGCKSRATTPVKCDKRRYKRPLTNVNMRCPVTDRDHVRAPQGLAQGCHTLRPKPEGFPLSHRTRRDRHALALQQERIVPLKEIAVDPAFQRAGRCVEKPYSRGDAGRWSPMGSGVALAEKRKE